MNFRNLGRFQDLVHKHSESPSEFNLAINGIACFYDTSDLEYGKFWVMTTSVTSSFWDLYEFEDDNGNKQCCIFIPRKLFLKTCIAIEDIESLKLCGEWMKFIEEGSLDELIDYYFDNYEIFYPLPKKDYSYLEQYIPSTLKRGEQYRRFADDWENQDIPDRNGNSLLLSLSNDCNPSSTSAMISKLCGETINCGNMLDYITLVNSGIDMSRIRIILGSHSGSLLIQIAAENPSLIFEIYCIQIAEYIMLKNSDNVEEVIRLAKSTYASYLSNAITLKTSIQSCIAKYGSLDMISDELFSKLLALAGRTIDTFKYTKPLLEQMHKRGKRIHTTSSIFSIILPDVKYNLIEEPTDDDEEDNEDEYKARVNFVAFSENVLDISKKDFLSTIASDYDRNMLSRLYELYISGFITRDDIIEHGLHLMYAVCDWMINKIDKMKGCKATLSA